MPTKTKPKKAKKAGPKPLTPQQLEERRRKQAERREARKREAEAEAKRKAEEDLAAKHKELSEIDGLIESLSQEYSTLLTSLQKGKGFDKSGWDKLDRLQQNMLGRSARKRYLSRLLQGTHD